MHTDTHLTYTYLIKNGKNGPTNLINRDGNISANNIAPVEMILHILPAPASVLVD